MILMMIRSMSCHSMSDSRMANSHLATQADTVTWLYFRLQGVWPIVSLSQASIDLSVHQEELKGISSHLCQRVPLTEIQSP